MNATLTEKPALSIGSLIEYTPPADGARLALVAEVLPDETFRVICPALPEAEELVTFTASIDDLTPAPPLPNAQQWDLVRRLTVHLVEQLDQGIRRQDELATSLRHQVEVAEAKIASMRPYAIDAHRDGTICLDGLNDFLTAHDLPAYVPRHRARVTISADIEIDGATSRHDARDLIEDYVEITSTSEDVTITDEFGVEVSDLELVAD